MVKIKNIVYDESTGKLSVDVEECPERSLFLDLKDIADKADFSQKLEAAVLVKLMEKVKLEEIMKLINKEI